MSLKEWSSQNVRQTSRKTREGGLSESRTGLEQNEPFRTKKTSSKSAVSFQEDHCVVSRNNSRVKQGNSTTNWRAECQNAGADCAKVKFYNQDSFKWESCLSWWTLQRIKDKRCSHYKAAFESIAKYWQLSIDSLCICWFNAYYREFNLLLSVIQFSVNFSQTREAILPAPFWIYWIMWAQSRILTAFFSFEFVYFVSTLITEILSYCHECNVFSNQF